MGENIQFQQSNPSPFSGFPNNNRRSLLATIGIILIAVLVIGSIIYFSYKNITSENQPLNQPQTIKDVKNEIFIATYEDPVLSILIFNPAEKKTVVSKKIILDDYISSRAKTTAWGTDDAVQYNPKTQEIFIATEGFSYFGGECINKDGTCVSRIYKIGLNETKPIVLFESNAPITNWLVNKFDNSLLVGLSNEKIQSLIKINAGDSKIIFTKEYQIREHVELANFVLSGDGKFTYQMSKESINGSWLYEILELRKIDNSSGDILTQEIFKGESIEYETDLSPDNNYLAFYTNSLNLNKLYICEIPTKKIIDISYQDRVGNYNLFWSGDSKKLLYILKNSIAYYDILTSKNVLIIGDPQEMYYVYNWAPSDDYFAYSAQDNTIKLFNIIKNQIIDTQIIDEYNVKGITWY